MRPPVPSRVRVATLNLASGRAIDLRAPTAPRPTTASLDDAALLAALAPFGPGGRDASVGASLAGMGVDVLALQEVDLHQQRSHGVDQLAVAARALGADPAGAAYAPALLGTPGVERKWVPAPAEIVLDGSVDRRPMYGVALVSRLPVVSWHVLRLPAGHGRLPLPVNDPESGRRGVLLFPDEPRVALAAQLDGGRFGPLTVVCTHLSFWAPTALRQLRMLRGWMRRLPGPVVLAGDLNLPGRLPGRLLGAASTVRQHTYPGDLPRLQLDHLLLLPQDAAGVRHRPAGAVALAVGDHRGLVVDLSR